MTPELAADIAAADLNYRDSYRKLVEHVVGAEWRDFGPIAAFTTRLPIAIFNGVMVLDGADASAVGEAIDWVRSNGMPFRVWLRAERFEGHEDVLRSRELERGSRMTPGMLLRPVPLPPGGPPGVAIVPVEGDRMYEAHLRVVAASGVPAELARRLFPRSFALDADVRLFTATLDARPVGTSIALRTGVVSGVYNVATLPHARRRGVGRAATWAAVAAGREWGCERIVLQASAMGESLYASMGFRPVVRYVTFGPPAAEPGRER